MTIQIKALSDHSEGKKYLSRWSTATKLIIAITIGLYCSFYFVSKTLLETSLIFSLAFLITHYKKCFQTTRQNKEVKYLFLTAGVYSFSFLFTFLVQETQLDLKYFTSTLRDFIPIGLLMIVAFATGVKFTPKETIYILSAVCGAGALAIIYDWSNHNFQNRPSIGTNLIIIYATTLASSIAILFSLRTKYSQALNGKAKRVSEIAITLSLVALVANNSRGAWLGLMAALSLFILLSTRKRDILPIILICAAAGIVLLTNDAAQYRLEMASQNIERYFSGDSKSKHTSEGQRLDMWKQAYNHIMHSPLTGTGSERMSERFPDAYKKKQLSVHTRKHIHVHNDYLEAWSARGIIGFVSLLAILATPLLLVRKTPVMKYCILPLTVVYGVCALTDVPFLHDYSLRFYWLLVILFLFFDPNEDTQRSGT